MNVKNSIHLSGAWRRSRWPWRLPGGDIDLVGLSPTSTIDQNGQHIAADEVEQR